MAYYYGQNAEGQSRQHNGNVYHNADENSRQHNGNVYYNFYNVSWSDAMRGHTLLREDPWRHDLERLRQLHDPPVNQQSPYHRQQILVYDDPPPLHHRRETSPQPAYPQTYYPTAKYSSQDSKRWEEKQTDKGESKEGLRNGPSAQSREPQTKGTPFQPQQGVIEVFRKFFDDAFEKAQAGPSRVEKACAEDRGADKSALDLTTENVEHVPSDHDYYGTGSRSRRPVEAEPAWSRDPSVSPTGATNGNEHDSEESDGYRSVNHRSRRRRRERFGASA